MAQPARNPKPSPTDQWWLEIPVPQTETRSPTRQISARMPPEDLDILECLVGRSNQNLTIYLRWLVRVAAAGEILPPGSRKIQTGS